MPSPLTNNINNNNIAENINPNTIANMNTNPNNIRNAANMQNNQLRNPGHGPPQTVTQFTNAVPNQPINFIPMPQMPQMPQQK